MRQRPFTVVELIVVLVVAMIMMGMALATFNAVVGGTAVETGSRQIGSAAAYARQLAISRRRRCAVVMPGNIGADSSVEVGKLFKYLRLAYVDSEDNFVAWTEDSKWLHVPDGVLIMEADADMGIQDNSGYDDKPEENQPSTIDNVDLSELGGGTTVDNVRAVIFLGSGRLGASGARYVTVGRANYTGTTWNIVDPETDPDKRNRSCVDQITIEINKFTGSVSYIYPGEYL